MTIERDKKGRFLKGGTKNPKAYTWKKGQVGTRNGLNKKNNESVRRQSIKISQTMKKQYKEGIRLPNKCNPKTKGEKHWNWKNGVTPVNEKIRRTKEYKLWRYAVLERDNFTCIFCGKKGWVGKGFGIFGVNADHIKPFSKYPELRFAIDNGRTLCIECHKKTDTYGGNSKCIKNN